MKSKPIAERGPRRGNQNQDKCPSPKPSPLSAKFPKAKFKINKFVKPLTIKNPFREKKKILPSFDRSSINFSPPTICSAEEYAKINR